MWRNLARQSSTRNFKFSPSKVSQTTNFLKKITSLETQTLLDSSCPLLGFRRTSFLSSQKSNLGQSNFTQSIYPFGVLTSRSYASSAEAIASESELSGSEEVQELIDQFNEKGVSMLDSSSMLNKQPKKKGTGMGTAKYYMLKRRQIKIETEAWEQAAKEYQDLLADMCEQKLAPNLPYVKSLFLGWFEPLRDAIAKDQATAHDKWKHKTYAPYFNNLPADMMAVITMHKLVGLLMTNAGEVRVVQAACQIGEAIENEVGKLRIFWILMMLFSIIWLFGFSEHIFLNLYVVDLIRV